MRKWMTYCLAAFPWTFAIIFNMSLTFETSAVIDGVCHGYIIWENRVVEIVHGIVYFVSFYAGILLIFVLCYWRILTSIRRQAKVMTCHSAAGTAHAGNAQAKANHRIQSNVINQAISESPTQQSISENSSSNRSR